MGGLGMALALSRVGHRVIVIERRESPEDGGAGLHIWGNGTLALDRLGVLDAVLDVAPRQRVCAFRDSSGLSLGAWPVAKIEADFGYPTIAVERAELVSVLRRALPEGVLRVGLAVTRAVDLGDQVRVFLEDGSSMDGVALVAADGIHSKVRAGLPGARKVQRHGYVAWRGTSCDNLVAPGTFEAYFGAALRFTYYDIAPGVVHWMAVLEGDDDIDATKPPRLQLGARYAEWPAVVRRLVEGADEERIIRHDIIDRSPERSWGRGRITLAGDAAHPITFNLGQGAGQALEDALELQQQLDHCDAQTGIPTAFRRYEDVRRRRTAPLQRLARQIGRLGRLSSRLGMRTRGVLMRLVWDRNAYQSTRRDIAYALTRYPTKES